MSQNDRPLLAQTGRRLVLINQGWAHLRFPRFPDDPKSTSKQEHVLREVQNCHDDDECRQSQKRSQAVGGFSDLHVAG